MQRRGYKSVKIHDLPLGVYPTILNVQQPIGYCKECQRYHTHRPRELHPSKAMSWRLMKQISYLLKESSATTLAQHFGISATSVLRADKEILELLDRVYPIEFDNLSYLIIDEKYLGKRQKYITCVIDNKGELLFMEQGKSKEVLSEFFLAMTVEQRHSIKAISIDRSNSFYYAIKEHLPHTQICFDPFHIISNVNEAINAIRKQAHLMAGRKNKSFFKGARYLLLKAREKLTETKQTKLQEVLECNEPLYKAYWLKEQLRSIYQYRNQQSARILFEQWISLAEESEVYEFKKLARNMKKRLNEILNFFRFKLTSGRIEGLNSTISLISHKMRGISSIRYLYLKVRQKTSSFFARLI